MADNIADDKESLKLEEYILQNKLDKRIAAVDKEYLAFVTNRAFSDYFEYIRFIKITDYVYSDELDELKQFCNSFKGDPISKIFRFRFKDGTYRFNLLKIYSDAASTDNYKNIENGEYWFNIELIDVEALEESNKLLKADAANLRTVFAINEEYTFAYDKNTNIFCMYRYETLQKVTVYNMDIDEWRHYIIDNKMVTDDDIIIFNELINDIKSYKAEFSATVNSNIRTKNEIYEKLRFEGRQVSNDNKHIIVGRMLAEDSTQKISKELIEELHCDSLTGVYNKKTITEYAKNLVKQEKKNRVTIVILDIDHFKEVNDTFGHLFGDKILHRVGNRLRSLVGDDGVVGRIGGDEFMIVFNGINDDTILRGRLRSIRTQIKWEFANDFEKTHITTSIGASIYPNNGTDYEDLFKKADYCLYLAKEKGRDRYVFFRDEMHRASYEAMLNQNQLNAMKNPREIRELKNVASFMENAMTDSRKAILDAMKHMKDTFGIDNINIYYGEGMKKVYSFGSDISEAKDAMYVFSEEFQKLMGENERFMQIGFADTFSDITPDFCGRMKAERIASTIQCYIGDKRNIKGLVTFNKCREASQWANYEIDCARIFAAVLSSMALNDIGTDDCAIY